MNAAEMHQHQKNEATDNDYWVYNEMNATDTTIAISEKKIASVKTSRKVSLRRALLLGATMGRDHYIIINTHMPTKWQTTQEYKDCIGEIKQAWTSMARELQTPITIMMGGYNTSMWNEHVDETGRAMKELLAFTGSQQHIPPPRVKGHGEGRSISEGATTTSSPPRTTSTRARRRTP